jgi:hypothetical protein
VAPVDTFFNFFWAKSMLNSSTPLADRFVAVNAMNQKFYKMFNTASTQQRILAN